MSPLLILLIGILIVVGIIVFLRLGAFIALLTAAVVVSLLAPGDWADKIPRMATAFGNTAGAIGLVIAAATIIGRCLLLSGGADRIVSSTLKLFGQEKGGLALMSSGFILSVPVFFDTVFYLLVPLAQSMYRQTGKNYVRFLVAIAAGAVITHTLVPPTPGPLFMADALNVDMTTMILIGGIVGLPCALIGLGYAYWIDRKMQIAPERLMEFLPKPKEEDSPPPSLFASLLPIALPVLLISGVTFGGRFLGKDYSSPIWNIMLELGDKNVAMLLAAVAAIIVYVRQKKPSFDELSHEIQLSLSSGSVIILITAAGGSFGAMLKTADVGTAVQQLFSAEAASQGLFLMAIGYGLAFLLKIAQGSGTVSMMAASSMIAALIPPGDAMGIHPVYLALSIGFGSLGISWMNDSGFWVFSQMGGLTEWEAIKTWTALLAILSVAGFLMTIGLAIVLPNAF